MMHITTFLAAKMLKFFRRKLKDWAYKVIGVDEDIVNYQVKSHRDNEYLKENDRPSYLLNNDLEFDKARIDSNKHFNDWWNAALKLSTQNAAEKESSGWNLAHRENDFGVYNQSMSNLVNSYTGTGGSTDFSSYDQRSNPSYEFQEVYTTLYQTSPLAKRLIDLLTSSCLQDGCTYTSPVAQEKEEKKAIEEVTKFSDYFEEQGIDQVFNAAVRQMFLHGGSAIWMNDGKEDQATPLHVKKGQDIKFYLVDKSLMFPAGFMDILNIGSSNFNQPTHWRLVFSQENMATQRPIHHSRFIFLVPEVLPFFARINQLWWGNSVLLTVRNYINIVERSFSSTGNQISQASMGILKVQLRNKAVNPKVLENQNSRFQKALTQNGSMNVFDLKDEIERLEVGNLNHQAQAAKIIQSIICTTYGIPWSVFDSYPITGTQSSDGDLVAWYKQVMMNKKNYIYRPMNQLVKVISKIMFGDENRIKFEFNDPNAPNEQQIADMNLKVAQYNAINVNTLGLELVPYIAKSIAREKVYPDLTMEEAENIVYVSPQTVGPSMEGKDVKDGLDKKNSPTSSVQASSPENVVTKALKK